MKKNLLLTLFLYGALFSFNVLAATSSTVTIDTSLPGPYNISTTGPVGAIGNIYYFAMALGGLLAFGSIVFAGIKWTASRGNTSAISDARDQITQAVIGLLLLMGSFIVLNTINPQLTILKFPELTPIPLASSTAGTAASSTQEYSCFSGGNSGDTCYADSACNGECASGETCQPDSECLAAAAPGACADGPCVDISGAVGNIKSGSGTTADSKMLSLLQCIQGAGISNLRITEAMPPTSQHKSHAHTDGCAVDATLGPAGAIPAGGCAALTPLLSAISNCGGTDLNEYYNQCGGANTELSTGDHVHIAACY